MSKGTMVHIELLLCYLSNESYCFHWWIGKKKKKSISRKHGSFTLNCKRKKRIVWTKIYIFFVIISSSCQWISSKVFKEVVLFSFACYIYIQRNPRSYFVSKFRSIWRKLCYQFYLAWNKTAEIMEKVCEVGPKNLRKNFGLKNLP